MVDAVVAGVLEAVAVSVLGLKYARIKIIRTAVGISANPITVFVVFPIIWAGIAGIANEVPVGVCLGGGVIFTRAVVADITDPIGYGVAPGMLSRRKRSIVS
jgi:hypothetical protein